MSLPRVCICRLVGNRLDVVSSREGERQHEPRSLLADTTLPCHLRIDNREYIRGTITVLWSRRMCLRFDWLVLAAHNRVWHCGHCEATTIQLIIIYARSASKSIIYHRHKCGESRFLSHSGAPVQWDHPLPRIAPHRFTSHPSLITLALWNAHLSPRIRLFVRGASVPHARLPTEMTITRTEAEDMVGVQVSAHKHIILLLATKRLVEGDEVRF